MNDKVGHLAIDLDVPVPMRDGTVLKADVFRPASGKWHFAKRPPRSGLIERHAFASGNVVTLFVSGLSDVR